MGGGGTLLRGGKKNWDKWGGGCGYIKGRGRKKERKGEKQEKQTKKGSMGKKERGSLV